MTKIRVLVANDHLERISKKTPLQAVCELIWNAYDGDADNVAVELRRNELSGLECVKVIDDGLGITHERAESSFGHLGDSWKRLRRTSDKGRILHGNAGEGRFAAFALGGHVEWRTTFKERDSLRSLSITGTLANLGEFDLVDAAEPRQDRTGTEVVVRNIQKEPSSLWARDVDQRLAKDFAAYLLKYRRARLVYDGRAIDPSLVVAHHEEHEVRGCTTETGQPIKASLLVIEWKFPGRELMLCDAGGFPLESVHPGVHAKGFDFTAYLKSDFLRECHETNQLILDDMQSPVLKRLIDAGKRALKGHFRRREAEQARGVVEQWKAERVYPYEGTPSNPVEAVERQVFDVMALNMNEYLPEFADSDAKSKRLALHMLKAALEQNPSQVTRIFKEVLDLPQEKREELAELLDRTTLSAIINASKLIVDRLDFLAGLEVVLFHAAAKKKLKERKHLHRILAESTWIFGEEYNLTVDDEGLSMVLEQHLALLGREKEDDADDSPVTTLDGGSGIVDLMLSRKLRLPRGDEYEHLVIELKRPSKKVTGQVLSQVKRYALAVANDERFRSSKVRWTFWALSNDIDPVAADEANQQHRAPGVAHVSHDGRITVWAKTWNQVLDECRGRLQFFQERLGTMATHEQGLAHFQKTYQKYLPGDLPGMVTEPFRRVDPSIARRYVNSVPLFELRVAAGSFSPDQFVADANEDCEGDKSVWVAPTSSIKPSKGLFVAQIVGNSMNRRVKDGEWGLFRLNPVDPEGRPVLVWRPGDLEADGGGQFVLKVFKGEYAQDEDGNRITVACSLVPDSDDDSYKPLLLGKDGVRAQVVAELLEVLGRSSASATPVAEAGC